MAAWALALCVLYLVLAFGGRTLLQLRRTGSTGFKGISGRPFSIEWTGGILFAVAVLLGLAAPVLTLAGAMEPAARRRIMMDLICRPTAAHTSWSRWRSSYSPSCPFTPTSKRRTARPPSLPLGSFRAARGTSEAADAAGMPVMELLVRASGIWVPRDGEPVAAMDGMNMAGDKVNEPLGLRLALGRCDEDGGQDLAAHREAGHAPVMVRSA